MECSEKFRSSLHSVPSPDGMYIATLLSSQLLIRSAKSLDITRTIQVKQGVSANAKFLRWSPRIILDDVAIDEASFIRGLQDNPNGSSESWPPPTASQNRTTIQRTRLLLADHDTILVWDVEDATWSATINKAGEQVPIVNVEFGRDADEVIAFADCNIRASIWNLGTGRCVKIRDPKFSGKAFGWRAKTGHFALLARPAAQDIIMIHSPTSYDVVNQTSLAASDLQGLKWSTDGKWLVAWDSASRGFSAQIYTADGTIYKSLTREFETEVQGLGITIVEWSASAEYLAIGDYDNKVTLLSDITFTTKAVLDHPTTINVSNVPIWQELKNASGQRAYATAPQSMNPPSAGSPAADSMPKSGISLISFSEPSRQYMCTRSEGMPTTVWIWSLASMKLAAVLVHHSTVKTVQWHPTISSLLFLQCADADNTIFLWNDKWESPRIETVPFDKFVGRVEARWLWTQPPKSISPGSSPSQLIDLVNGTRCPTILFGDVHNFLLAYVQDDGFVTSPGPMFARNGNEESPTHHNKKANGHVMGHDLQDVDDTFQYRQHIGP